MVEVKKFPELWRTSRSGKRLNTCTLAEDKVWPADVLMGVWKCESGLSLECVWSVRLAYTGSHDNIKISTWQERGSGHVVPVQPLSMAKVPGSKTTKDIQDAPVSLQVCAWVCAQMVLIPCWNCSIINPPEIIDEVWRITLRQLGETGSRIVCSYAQQNWTQRRTVWGQGGCRRHPELKTLGGEPECPFFLSSHFY